MLAAGVTLVALLLAKRARIPPPSVTVRGPLIALMGFVVWLWIQSFWAIDAEQHQYFLTMYAKFVLVLYLIYRCVDSEYSLKVFLWAHILGCFNMGWIAFTSYTGGRFEEFGGAGLSEANTAALQMLTGVFMASSLLIAGGTKEKAALLGVLPFILNGIVATVSRSAFLAILSGGLTFNLTSPRPVKKLVKFLSILALVLFVLLTGPTYWSRIESIKYRGQEVEGIDTGGGRLEILSAQIRMIENHPMGCGHQCTGALSPGYIDQRYLSASTGQRSSHNTVMSMLVDHGPVGGFMYVLMVVWVYRNLRRCLRMLRYEKSFLAVVATGVAASFVAIIVSDQFVPNTRLEARIWFIGLVVVLTRLLADRELERTRGDTAAADVAGAKA
jgi:hypothetical protein